MMKKGSVSYTYFDFYVIAYIMKVRFFMFGLVELISFVNIYPFLHLRPEKKN